MGGGKGRTNARCETNVSSPEFCLAVNKYIVRASYVSSTVLIALKCIRALIHLLDKAKLTPWFENCSVRKMMKWSEELQKIEPGLLQVKKGVFLINFE